MARRHKSEVSHLKASDEVKAYIATEIEVENMLKEIDEKGMIANENDGRHITSVLEYNDQVIFPDKVRLNLYYLDHYSFAKDIQMLVCTVFGKQMTYAGELI